MNNKKFSPVGSSLTSDPKIEQGKKLILDAIKEHQKKLTSIRPADNDLKQNYEHLLTSFAECRGSKLWFPYLGSGIGNGLLVELLDGSVKYDFISGIGVHYLGHSHPALISAGIDAAIQNTIMEGHLQQNADAIQLSLALVKAVKMDHCFLTMSGAMANENALKIIFQKRFPAHRWLAFERNFFGRTTLLSQITDKPAFREGLPDVISVDYVPFFDPECPNESIEKAAYILKKHLQRHPKEYAGMSFELVQGEAGFYPGSKEFFKTLMTILKENHVSILVDEIQTFGRTPQICAFHFYELEEFVDVVSIGKVSQICATLFTKEHRPRPGLLSQTFTSSASAIHASLTILNEIMNGNYFGSSGKIVQLHKKFSSNLTKLSQKHPEWIKGPFGIGTMIAFTPFDGEYKTTVDFVHRLFEEGVLSFIAGLNPTRVRFLIPPGITTEQDIDCVTEILEKTFASFQREKFS